jgi:asparagine synthase (glutamine-hydrolysing)
MVNEAGDVAVVFNGEIYNFRDLRAVLCAHGYRFATDCDTEVVLRAYEHYGSRCVEHFRGMFAFAVWDGPRRELFLARDRFGIKPLYYAWDGRTFRFGSELKAILEAGASRALDATALDALHLQLHPGARTSHPCAAPRTPCRSRRAAGRARILGSRLRADAADAATARAVGEVLRKLALHLEWRPASFSGGVDSSALTAWRRSCDGPVDTFSMGFAEPQFDERPLRHAVADRCGTRTNRCCGLMRWRCSTG